MSPAIGRLAGALLLVAVKALDPDIVIPMHCSGTNFIAAAREQMPDKLLVSTVGSRFTFGV